MSDAWVNAGSSSASTFQSLGTMAIYFLAFWPLCAAPLALIGVGLWASANKRVLF